MTVPFLTTETPATPVQKFLNGVIIPAINAGIAASGTVTNVSVVANDGLTASVTNPTTTPNITLGLGGTLTPNAVHATGQVTGSNLSGTNTGDVTLTGENYLSISGQHITVSSIDLAQSYVTGNLGIPHFNSGINADATTYWRGDATWVTIPPAITGVAVTSSNLTIGGSPLSPPGGTITVNLPTTGVSAGTYNKVTVDTLGRVTAATLQNYPTYTGASSTWIPFVTGPTPGVLANSYITYNQIGANFLGPIGSEWFLDPAGLIGMNIGLQIQTNTADSGGVPFGSGIYLNQSVSSTRGQIVLVSQSAAGLLALTPTAGSYSGPIGTVLVQADVVATGATITVDNGAWNGSKGSTADIPLTIKAKGTSHLIVGSKVDITNDMTFTDAKNILVGSTTGTKIGTATTQKLSLWGVTPVVQPATTGTTAGFTAGAGTAVDSAATFTGGVGSAAYTIGDIVLALKQLGALAT